MALAIEAFGEVRVCTSSMEPLFNLNSENISLKDILNKSPYDKINKAFQEGHFPSACLSCEKVEKLDIPSKREIFNNKRMDKWGRKKVEEILNSKKKKPLHLSVGFSNKCNLQCAMCSSKYSSLWLEDEQNAKGKGLLSRDTYGSFRLNKENLAELIDIASEATDIFIKGGEPFFNEDVFTFLGALNSFSEKPHIFIQSNGTLINERVMALIEKHNIEIGISIDGVFETYEWVRGFPYSKIKENILRFANLDTDHAISLDYTSSVYNTMDLRATYEELGALVAQNSGVSHLSLVSIARQVENDLRNLPLGMRESVAIALTDFDFPIESEKVLLKTMATKQLDELSQNKAKQWIRFLEEKRGPIPSRKLKSFESWLSEDNDV